MYQFGVVEWGVCLTDDTDNLQSVSMGGVFAKYRHLIYISVLIHALFIT